MGHCRSDHKGRIIRHLSIAIKPGFTRIGDVITSYTYYVMFDVPVNVW